MFSVAAVFKGESNIKTASINVIDFHFYMFENDIQFVQVKFWHEKKNSLEYKVCIEVHKRYSGSLKHSNNSVTAQSCFKENNAMH